MRISDWTSDVCSSDLCLTADLHYTAAHYYDPDKARFRDFEPFWEFVSGPVHAGTFGPGGMDDTFGPQVVFSKDEGGTPNLPPSAGLQFFGHGRTGAPHRRPDATGLTRKGAPPKGAPSVRTDEGAPFGEIGRAHV